MKHLRQSTLRKLISLMLILTLVFGSTSELFAGISAALAESVATPTDLMPRYPDPVVPEEPETDGNGREPESPWPDGAQTAAGSAEVQIMDTLPDEAGEAVAETPSDEAGEADEETSADEAGEAITENRDATEAEFTEAVAASAETEQTAVSSMETEFTEAVAASAAAVLKDDGNKVSALQQMIQKKLDGLAEKKGRVTITLSKDTTYEGDVTIEKKKDTTYGDDFSLDLVAEDAGDDGLQGSGSVKVGGTITINGISVKLTGIAVGGAISVKGAKVDIYGTKKDDTYEVTAEGGAKVNLVTGDGKDTVTGTISGDGTMTMKTGKGNDKVTASVEGEGTLTVESGEGDDTLDVGVYGGKASVNTGAGSDKVKLTDASSGDVLVETGEGGDQVTVNAEAGTQNLTVYTGDGDDKVEVSKKERTTTGTPSGRIHVGLGAGNDEVSVDTSLAETAETVSVVGGEGNDRLIYTGKLKKDTAADKRIIGTTEDLRLAGEKGTLRVTAKEIENYADTLTNKQTVKLTPGVTGELVYTASKPFTDYLINLPSNKLESLTISTADGKTLPLSSVIIGTASTEGDGNKLTVAEGKTYSVNGLRLMLRARNIEVNGTLIAEQIELQAQDGTGLNQTGMKDVYNAVASGEKSETIADKATKMTMDLFNVSNEATIVIGEKAAVYSAGDVILVAKVEQKGEIVTFLPHVNVVNVKVARAGIDIAGKVYAGYDFAKQTSTKERGSVTAEASVTTSMGYNKDGKVAQGMPLAVNVASAESFLTVRKGATVEAAGDVTLSAGTTVDATARADSGAGGLPASVGVSVLLSDAHTTVDGTVKANAGSVKAQATGDTTGNTIAEKGEGQESISGGYIGAAVVLQDVAAKINKTAAVNAGRNVTVKSVAKETVNTQATSGAAKLKNDAGDDWSDTENIVIGALQGLWPVIKEKIRNESAQEKLNKALKKLVTSNKSARLDDNAGKKGDVRLDLDESAAGAKAVTGKITVTPWPGYRVKAITWRGYNPGDKTYKTGTLTSGGKFTLQAQNVIFFVEYEEDPGYKDSLEDTAADLFEEKKGTAAEETDPSQLVTDATSGANDGSGSEEEKPKGDAAGTMALKLEGTDGAVLTYETDPQDGTKSLSKVTGGQKIRLVPNPKEGKALKQGGMKVTYYVKEKEKTVTKTEIVNPDGQNRYWFTAPADAITEKGIAVKAEFIDDGNPNKEADETQTQATGTVAVSVTRNDNEALVDAGATVTSGGKTEVVAEAATSVTSTADGTAATKAGVESTKEKDKDAIKRPEAKAYASFDAAGREYALLLEAAENGAVDYQKGAADYVYSFTAKPAEHYQVVSATLVYYEDGKQKTKELKAVDGKYTVNLLDIAMDKGSAARVGFAFGQEGAAGDVISSQEAKAIIPNAIQIAYNALKDEDNLSGYQYTGKIYYKEAKTDESGRITAYVFDAKPETGKGYVLDGALKASWTDENGSRQETALKQQADGSWALENAAAPAGAMITVAGTFKEDYHAFKADAEKTKNGAVILHDEQVKRADAPKITVKPDAGYAIRDLTVTYTQEGIKQTIKLSDKDSRIRKARDKDGKEIDGVYTFDVPGLTKETDITVQAEFRLKTIGLYAGNGDTAKNYVLSEKNAAVGDRITISPSADEQKKGNKVSSYTVQNDASMVLFSGVGNSFTIPDTVAENAKLTVIARVTGKDIALEEAKMENGAIKPDIPQADQGETVTVTITPENHYKVKKGSVKAVIKANDGSYTEEIYMSRQSDLAYSFIMPAGIEKPDQVKVTFVGEFEPGESNSSKVETSLGAGIAVTVSGSENRAEVKGTVSSGGDVTVKASQEGGAKTETKAGYSKGNIGIGGAVSVQVASLNSKALIHAGSQVTLKGALKTESSAKLNYGVQADASGKKEAENTGVGAGIAVAVNGSDAYAAVADGAKVTAKTPDSGLQSIAVTATQKIKDSVAAKAGAAGGTAAVPVAAADIIGSSAEAYLGKMKAEAMKVTGLTAVSATNETTHEITADASATGKGAGLGAAVAVSVATDTAVARINQSINGESVTVGSETVSELTETATASASGGKAKAKSADKQADGLLGGAAKIAGKNGSKNVSSKKIDNAAKSRQKAQTGEGTVGVAGAAAVNIQESTNRSEVQNGVHLTASKLIAVTAANRTEAKIKANASTTNSDTGIGVGASVNIVTLNNIAAIGDGEIKAAMLQVTATTKEKKPDSQKTVQMQTVDTKEGLARELGEAVTDYIRKLAKELGLDQYVPDTLLDDILGPVVTQTTDALIQATGLGDLLGKDDWRAKIQKALDSLSDRASALMALPEQLVEPLLSALREAAELGNMSAQQIEGIKQTLKDEFTTQLKDRVIKTGKSVIESVKDGMIKYLKDNITELMGAFSGGASEGFDSILEKLREQAEKEINKATEKALKALLVDTWKETLTRLTTSVPGLSQQNLDRALSAFEELKDAYQEGSVSGLIGDAASYAAGLFKKNVFDYETMLANMAKKDFGTSIGDALRAAAKKQAVTLTNSAVSKLMSKFSLTIEAAEAKATGHVISNDAISGAGARDVGVAGSAAITVLNAATKATLAENGGAVTVTGDTEVKAEELRSVRNVASAALDTEGKADANKAEEKSANKDVGSGSDAESVASAGHAKLTVGPGGTAEILQGDKADDKPKMYITLKEGYELPKDQKANYSYADGNGKEITGTIEIQKDGQGRWYVDPKSGDLAKVDGKTDVAIKITPAETLKTIAKPSVLTDGQVNVREGAVTVGVEGREAEKDTLSARPGETVEIRIEKGAGRKVSQVGYSWKDAEGKQHDIELNTSKDSKKSKEFTLVSSNEKEYIYRFNMPAGTVTDVVVALEKGEAEDAEDAKTAAKDGSGKRVGVGAAFSMIYGDSAVTADVGKRGITAGALSVTAGSVHKENVASAAGTDPLGGTLDIDQTKQFALDAAVSLNMLDNAVQAGAKTGSTIQTQKGNLTVTAKENSVTETTSGSFAVGDRTAIGASVAVNIASTGVKVNLASGATVAGDATIGATSHSEDTTTALATAMGADVARNLAKVGEKAENLAEKANKVLDGSYIDNIGKETDNETAGKINEKLDKKSKSGKETSGKAATSTNVLRSMGVETQSESAGQEGTTEAEKTAKEKTGQDVKMGREKSDKKWQAAAAVGVTVAAHRAETTVGAITAGGKIAATAENTGNFNTQGTGAAMSLAEHANSIAAGVAVSVNDNQAIVSAGGNLISNNKGDITVRSRLTQNMDGKFAGKLAAQALSGSVAGKNSGVSIGGAISIVRSAAASTVNITGGTAEAARTLSGGAITVEATDKSKLAARSGGLSISRGSSLGMGIASTNIISGNTVAARVGDYAKITGASFTLNAEKQAVTDKDYRRLIDSRFLITDSSAMTEEQRKTANTGLIDIHKGKDEDSYQVDVHLSSEKLLSAVDGLNFLSARNTYLEAIAGSLMTGSASGQAGDGSYLSLTGSVAVAVTNNTIDSRLGQGANITLTRDEKRSGDMTLRAVNGNNARIIAGALSAAPAKASVGATVAVLIGKDETRAETGMNSTVTADGTVAQKAETAGEIQTFTAAMSVAAGSEAKAAVGGAVNVIVNKNRSASILGTNAAWTAGGAGSVESRAAMDLIAISGSASAAAGSAVAAGGAVNVIYDEAKARTSLTGQNRLTAGKDLTISSEAKDRTLTGTASLSAAASVKGAGAGAASILIGRSAAETNIGPSAALTAAGDLKTTAKNDAWMLNASMALAGGAGTAIGGAFNINVVDRAAKVTMNDGTLKAGGNLIAQAGGVDTDILAGLSIAGGVQGSGLSGNVVVLAENNDIGVNIAKGVTAEAGGNVLLESYYQDRVIDVAGSIAASMAGTAVGATVSTVIRRNAVKTELAGSSVTAKNTKNATTKDLAGKDVSGIFVGASAVETQTIGAAGVAVSGGAAINGVVNVLVNKNQVIADASQAVLSARGEEKPAQDGKQTDVSGGGDVSVIAREDTTQLLLAGGVNGSAGAGVGASVVTVVSGKNVQAAAYRAFAAKKLNIAADNRDEIKQLAISVGVSGGVGVQIGAAVQVLKNKVRADAGGKDGALSAGTGDFALTSRNDVQLHNIGASVAVGGGAGVAPVGVVTYFQGESNARLRNGSTVDVGNGKNISITATSNKDINLYSLGATAGGVGVSGTANVLVSKDSAGAIAETDTTMRTGGDVTLSATGDYKLRSASAAFAAGGVGIGVNAVVSVMKSNTLAEMAGSVSGQAGNAKSLNVNAAANRDVINVVANLGVGGVGGGVSALVLVAGTKMSQDAADMIAYGNGSNRDKKTGFDAKAFMDTMEKNGVASGYYREAGDAGKNDLSGDTLAEDLAGNGHYESRESVGTTSGEGANRRTTFDGASGYRSADFNDTKYNDETGDTTRGEKLEAKDTEDIARARTMNTYTYQDTSKDAVIARIAAPAVVKADKVTVVALQPVAADLLGAVVGIGGVGAGVSAGVALLRSNVIASSLGRIIGASQGISVIAKSVAGKLTDDKNAGARDETILDLMANNGDKKQSAQDKQGMIARLKEKLNPSNRAIRTFALSTGIGAVGVAVSASVVLTDNVTQATLGGTVEKAGDVNVQAEHDYGTVLAATGALSAGMYAAGASVSVAQANGAVKADVARDANVSANNLNVGTASNVGVDAVAVTAGGGLIAANAGVGLAFNRLSQETGIGAGAAVTTEKNVNVNARSTTRSGSYLLGVSIGGVGVTLNAAVSDVDAKMDTYIGEAGDGKKTASVTAGGEVNIVNQASSGAKPEALSAAIGGVAVGGNVLLAFNDSRVGAAVRNAKIKGGSLLVKSDLAGSAESDLTALQAGLAAVGLSVNYADLNARNAAAVENSAVNVAGDMKVLAGTDKESATTAKADTISANVGLVTAGMNAAIARNRTKNYASLTGDGQVDVGGALTVQGAGSPKAKAGLKGLDIGLAKSAVTAVVALNDAESRAKVRTNQLHVKGKTSFLADQNAETGTDIKTGGGSLLSVTLGVGAAYGRTAALIDVTMIGETKLEGDLEATSSGRDATASTISNQSYDLISASGLAGTAYSQDVYDTKVRIKGNKQTIGGSANIRTIYDVTGKADVTPAAGGVSASLVELALNLAIAKNTVHAGAEYEAAENTLITGDLNVKTEGTAATDAKITSARIKVNGASLGVSYARSEMNAVQAATLRLSGNTEVRGGVNIRSMHKDVAAKASLGTSGIDPSKSIYVTLFNGKTNVSSAQQNLDSTAAILGARKAGNGQAMLTAGSLTVEANRADSKNTGKAEARTDGAREAALLTTGNLDAKATASENNNAMMQNVTATIARDVNINAMTYGEANATGFAPGSLSIVNGGASTVFAGIGRKEKQQGARVLLGDGVRITSGGVIKINSENNGAAAAKTESRTNYTLASVKKSNQPTESWYETSVILGKNVELKAQTSGKGVEIFSKTISGADSRVNGDSLGLMLNADTMKGENRITEDNKLLIGDGSKLSAKSSVKLETQSRALARAETIYNGKYSFVAGSRVNAQNTLDRDVAIQIGRNVTIDAEAMLYIDSWLGAGDEIITTAKQKAGGIHQFAKANSTTETTGRNRILIGAGSRIKGEGVMINTYSTGYPYGGSDGVGFRTNSEVVTSRFSGNASPDAYSTLKLDYRSGVYVNPERKDRVTITSTKGGIWLETSNMLLHTYNDARVDSDGGVGKVNSYAITDLKIENTVSVDKADLNAKDTVSLHTSAGMRSNQPAKFDNHAYAALLAVVGSLSPEIRIQGYVVNTIATANKSDVKVSGGFLHPASSQVQTSLVTETGKAPNVIHIPVKYNNLRLNALCAFELFTNFPVNTPFLDTDKILAGALKKALAPIEDIQRMVDVRGDITKAATPEVNREAAEKLYVLDVEAMLSKDVRVEEEKLNQSQLWVNMETHTQVFLLPNATGLYVGAGARIQYISEAHQDEKGTPVDVYTALTPYAASTPVIPVGSTGSLNFADGTLVLPDQAYFRMYLDEISGSWMIRRIREGFFQGIIAPWDQANAFAQGETDLPEGLTATGLTEADGSRFGLTDTTLYWLGDTPETAANPDQTLILLAEEKNTDRISAFRATAGSMAKGETPRGVSLVLYRDSKSDRAGAEMYNMMFFDTPEGEHSQVLVISNVLMGRELETPKSLSMTLRAFAIRNAEHPAYAINNHFYVLCDGTKGSVDLFDGSYQATFDGDTFESRYLRIEGIRNGDPQVTLKAGQTVWPERTGENRAEDAEGRTYALINGEWAPAVSQ